MRNITEFNKNWLFCAETVSEEKAFSDTVVHLPFFHNILTMPQCTFTKTWMPTEMDEGKTVYLEFTQISGEVEIYCNGTLLASRISPMHKFRIQLTLEADIRTEYKIEVKVKPAARKDGLFAFAGVSIITADSSHFGILQPGDGIYINSVIKDGKGEINIETEVIRPNNYDVVSYTVYNASGYEVASATAKPTSPNTKIILDSPDLWEGQSGACIYTLKAVLRRDSAVLDETSTTFGIRDISVENDGFFHLNGFKLPLDGAELTDCSAVKSDTENLHHLDGNALISAMLPTKTNLLSFCDKEGTLFWYCLPFGKSIKSDMESFREFLLTYRNHPSLAFTVCPAEADNEYFDEFIKTANEYAPETICAVRRNIENALDSIPEKAGLVLLDIPYKTQPEAYIAFNGRLSELQEKYPEKAFAVFAESPPKSECSIKESAEHHIRLWQAFCRQKGVIAYFAGILSDEKNGEAKRGLVSNDRSEVYDAFWFYKAQFSSEGFIKIVDPDICETDSKFIDLKCITNRSNLRILVNGKDKKYKSEKVADSIYVFRQLKLKPDLNIIEVSADDECDSIEIIRI